MKGVILAGGHGRRLLPLTEKRSKHLLPVHDRPMIMWPLSLFRLAGIEDVLLICRPDHLDDFRMLLGSGRELDLSIRYSIQRVPAGVAEALIIAEDFLDGGDVALFLGDNFLHGEGTASVLRQARRIVRNRRGACIFAYAVDSPHEYGVVELNPLGQVLSLEEKPPAPKSPFATPGFYFYDGSAVPFAKSLQPSARGELEITELNRRYLEAGALTAIKLDSDFRWFDMGAPSRIEEASLYLGPLVKIGRIAPWAQPKGG